MRLLLIALVGACSVPQVTFTQAGEEPCTESADCRAHEICATEDDHQICRCAPAYRPGADGCVFDGAPHDPMLSNGDVWASVGPGVVIAPDGPGVADPGEAIFDATALCEFSSLVQTFEMPPRDRAEPFQLIVTHRASMPIPGIGIAIGVGGQWFHARSLDAFRTEKFCLGDRAYGGEVELRIATTGSGCSTQARVHVDQLRIEPATEGKCPPPGRVVNGDFEQANGWIPSGSGDVTIGIVEGIGEAGTRAARFETTDRCGEGAMLGTAALPVSDAQAIELYWSGTAGARMSVTLGASGVATLHGLGNPRRTRFCVPASLRGTTTSLGFYLQRRSNTGCGKMTSPDRSIMLDNIAIVDDPECSGGDLTDPGVEHITSMVGPAPGWRLLNGHIGELAGGLAEVVNSSSARTGFGVLRLELMNACTTPPSASASFVVPTPVPGSWPVLRMFSNLSSRSLSTTFIELGTDGWMMERRALPIGAAFREDALCLPPGLAGRPLELRLMQQPAGPPCLIASPGDIALFDDFSVGSDPDCP